MRASQLIEWRDRHSLCPEVAARALGVTFEIYVAYEHGDVDIPAYIDFSCRYLTENPSEIVRPKDLPAPINALKTANATEIAVAALTLIQSTLLRLQTSGVISDSILLDISMNAIDSHDVEDVADMETWDRGVMEILRDVHANISDR